MKTMNIHRLHRFAFSVLLYVEPRRTLPDIERLSLAPPQRILSSNHSCKAPHLQNSLLVDAEIMLHDRCTTMDVSEPQASTLLTHLRIVFCSPGGKPNLACEIGERSSPRSKETLLNKNKSEIIICANIILFTFFFASFCEKGPSFPETFWGLKLLSECQQTILKELLS